MNDNLKIVSFKRTILLEIKLAQVIANVIDDYTFKNSGVDLDLIESSLTLVFNAFFEKFSKIKKENESKKKRLELSPRFSVYVNANFDEFI